MESLRAWMRLHGWIILDVGKSGKADCVKALAPEGAMWRFWGTPERVEGHEAVC